MRPAFFVGLVGCAALFSSCGGSDFTSDEESGLDDAGSGGGVGGDEGGIAPSSGGSQSGGTTSSGGTGRGGTPGAGGTVSTGGESGDGGSVTSDASPPRDAGDVRCTGADPTFPSFDKSCTSDGDCALVTHTTDCCGGQLYMGIVHDEQERFAEAEAICSSQYPACGCAAQGALTEEGTMVPWQNVGYIVVGCVQGGCTSRYTGMWMCGDRTCTADQYCSVVIGGPAGSDPSYSCVSLGACNTCDCLSSVGCDCFDQGGQVTVTCYAP